MRSACSLGGSGITTPAICSRSPCTWSRSSAFSAMSRDSSDVAVVQRGVLVVGDGQCDGQPGELVSQSLQIDPVVELLLGAGTHEQVDPPGGPGTGDPVDDRLHRRE